MGKSIYPQSDLTLLDRFALAAVPALIARKGDTTFREDASDAYTFAEIALEVRAERLSRLQEEAPLVGEAVRYDTTRWVRGLSGGLKFIGDAWTFEDSLFARRTFRPEDINDVVPCGPDPDSCDGADDARHTCSFHAIAHGAMDIEDVETPVAAAGPSVAEKPQDFCQRTPNCILFAHSADVACDTELPW